MNEERERRDLDPIPIAAPEWLAYLESKGEYDPIEANFRASIAQKAENARRANLYLEYRALLERRIQIKRSEGFGSEMDELTQRALEEAREADQGERKIEPFSYEKMSLDLFRSLSPEHPILKVAEKMEGDDGKILLEALRIVAYQWRMNASNWTQPVFIKQVYEVKEILNERADIRERIIHAGEHAH